MATTTSIKQRALQLAGKTAAGSVTPEEVGRLIYDTAAYAESVAVDGAALGIRRVYSSVAAMEADGTAPADSWGNPMKRGQLAAIYDGTPSGADNGRLYAFLKPGWGAVGQMGSGSFPAGWKVREWHGLVANDATVSMESHGGPTGEVALVCQGGAPVTFALYDGGKYYNNWTAGDGGLLGSPHEGREYYQPGVYTGDGPAAFYADTFYVADGGGGGFAGQEKEVAVYVAKDDGALYKLWEKPPGGVASIKAGSNGEALLPDGSGQVAIPLATAQQDGLMAAADKRKLDGLAPLRSVRWGGLCVEAEAQLSSLASPAQPAVLLTRGGEPYTFAVQQGGEYFNWWLEGTDTAGRRIPPASEYMASGMQFRKDTLYVSEGEAAGLDHPPLSGLPPGIWMAAADGTLQPLLQLPAQSPATGWEQEVAALKAEVEALKEAMTMKN